MNQINQKQLRALNKLSLPLINPRHRRLEDIADTQFERLVFWNAPATLDPNEDDMRFGIINDVNNARAENKEADDELEKRFIAYMNIPF